MRADRLLSILMLLQTRGSMTAGELADELEVSERTIYRDMTALSTAGIPVYAERGPGGGCYLIEDYRTNLTGLNSDEVKALFMLSIPAPLDQLGVGEELRAALLKLTASLSKSQLGAQIGTRQRIHLDSKAWSRADEPVPHLNTLQQALWQDRLLNLIYHSEFGTRIEQTVAPLGLVAKLNTWYLVGRHKETMRIIRVSHIEEGYILKDTFSRPDDFNLPAFWDNWCQRFEQNVPSFSVQALISPELQPHISRAFQGYSPTIIEQETHGWLCLRLNYESFEQARTHLLGLGKAVRVLRPQPLRESILDFAEQIIQSYRKETSP